MVYLTDVLRLFRLGRRRLRLLLLHVFALRLRKLVHVDRALLSLLLRGEDAQKVVGDLVVVLQLLDEVANDNDFVLHDAQNAEHFDVDIRQISEVLESLWIFLLLILVKDCSHAICRVIQDNILTEIRLLPIHRLPHYTYLLGRMLV